MFEPKWLIVAIGVLMVVLTLLMRFRPNPNTVNKDIVFCGFIASGFLVGGLFSLMVYQIYFLGGLGLLVTCKYSIGVFEDWLETEVKK